ncbi:MAG: VCBS repeat-containing protein [Anaerolineae bacterium]|nr:VCBS repeat-containing protein [Anaerolineae bacterium]
MAQFLKPNTFFTRLLHILLIFTFVFFCLLQSHPQLNANSVPFSSQKVLNSNASSARSVYAADIDDDGDLDVLSASAGDDKVLCYENKGDGTFGNPWNISVSADGVNAVFAADIDGDEKIDVLSADYNSDRITWYKNVYAGQPCSFAIQPAISINADGASSVFAGDIDGDGNVDVVSVSDKDNKLAWYENAGSEGAGTVWNENIISTELVSAKSVYAGDIDNDQDLDIVVASFSLDKISWFENPLPLETPTNSNAVWIEHVISTDADKVWSVFVADIDSDSHLDILSASVADGKVAWYRNDGVGGFIEQAVSASSGGQFDGAISVYAKDLDNDGDLDILSASAIDSVVAWYENLDGKGYFSEQRIVSPDSEGNTSDGARSVFAGDLDGDGANDILSASASDNKVAWYRNLIERQVFLPFIVSPAVWKRVGNMPVKQFFDVDDCGNILLAGTDSGLYRLKNDTWQQGSSELQIPTAEVRGLTFVGSDCTKIYVTTVGAGVYYSNNSGTSWTKVTLTANLNNARSVVVRGNTVFVSGDFGITWAAIPSGTNHNWQSTTVTGAVNSLTILPLSQSIFAAVWNDGVYSNVTDGGQWTKQGTLDSNDKLVYEAIGTESNQPYAVGTVSGIFYWDQGNWRKASTNNGNTHAVISFQSQVFAGQKGVGVLSSNNGGMTWSPFISGMDTSGGSNFEVRGLYISDDQNALYAATTTGIWRWILP